MTTLNAKIILNVKSEAEWQASDIILDEGELGITNDTNNLKIGNGSSTWNNLPSISSTSISQLQDIDVTGVASGQVLQYNGSKWVPYTLPAQSTTLAQLTDVDVSNVSANQVLTYSGTKWVPGTGGGSGAASLSQLTDVNVTGVQTNQVLKYNGTKWVPGAATGVDSLNDLSDVTTSGVTNGNILKYDSSQQKFKPVVNNLNGISDVVTTGVSDGKVLTYDGASAKWRAVTPANAPLQVVSDTTSTTATLDVAKNTLYVFTQPLTSLTINSIDSDYANSNLESAIIFTASQDNILHADVLSGKWLGVNAPTIEANGQYLIQIRYGLGICNKFNTQDTPTPTGEFNIAFTNDIKVPKDITTYTQTYVGNSVYNNSKINIFGAKNETVSFTAIVNAPSEDVSGLKFEVSNLVNGANSIPTTTNTDVYDYQDRNIEVFVAKYLQIRGLSKLGFEGDYYNERCYPYQFQDPDKIPEATAGTQGTPGLWENRPWHDKYIPDIAMPMEVYTSGVNVPEGESQLVYIDVYIPKGTPAGTYTGTFTVKQGNAVHSTYPISLEVLDFSLPDTPSSKFAAWLNGDFVDRFNIQQESIPHYNSESGTLIGTEVVPVPFTERYSQIHREYMRMLHRHHVCPIGDPYVYIDSTSEGEVVPSGAYEHGAPGSRVSSYPYSEESGYGGYGANTSDEMYCLGDYGKLSVYERALNTAQEGQYPAWELKYNYIPGASDNSLLATLAGEGAGGTAYLNALGDVCTDLQVASDTKFLYIIDEPGSDLTLLNKVNSAAQTLNDFNTDVNSFCTSDIAIRTDSQYPVVFHAVTDYLSDVQILACPISFVDPEKAEEAIEAKGENLWAYNGQQPLTGCLMTEATAISPRSISWAQYLAGISHWWYWSTARYYDDQGDGGNMNVFNTAKTIGYVASPTSENFGESGYNASNGDGLLLYPGTDNRYSSVSVGLDGPIASLRLKYLRRGIQDYEYIAQAYAKNPTETMNIVRATVNSGSANNTGLWAYTPNDPNDATYGKIPCKWKDLPTHTSDTWEQARRSLASIILS